MADEQQPQSIADRIASLKLNQVGKVPSQPPPSYEQATHSTNSTGRPKPPPPPRPTVPARPHMNGRTQSTNVPPNQGHATVSNSGINNLPEEGRSNGKGMDGISRPALPPRTATQSSQSPALPPRRPSESPALPVRRPSEAPSAGSRRLSDYPLSRKASNDSVSSIATARSGLSGVSNGTSVTSSQSVKAPAFDPTSVPPLPPKRTQEEVSSDFKKYNAATSSKPSLKSRLSSPSMQQKQVGTTPPPPARPSGRQPSVLLGSSESIQDEAPARIEPPPRQRTEPPPLRKSALSYGLNNSTNTTPPVPTNRPGSIPQTGASSAPPPIPTGSKPDLAALQASKPKVNGATASPAATSGPAGSCLLCRDYSAPDAHAARFPRHSIPSQDLGWLAHQLTSPFPSHTDKARVLFTWLHHNVAYDTVAFFNNNVKPSTPQSTLSSGMAVCEGYAALFAALAMKVGMEALVVGGHGKGYGYSKLQPGDPLPPYSAGHAWNAVKIDGGQWKLIDCCWGAGTVGGKNKPYKKGFDPERFTQSNEEFGLDHFPGDTSKQFRSDGRVVNWEEYILGNKNGCGTNFYSGFVASEGLSATTFKPPNGNIVLAQQPGPSVRFSFQKKCPHWDPVRCGKGPYYLYVLALDGLNGTQRNHVPFETNGDVWWCDVPVHDLGRPGMKAMIYTVTSFDGGDGRGLTIQRYREKKGTVGWAFGGVCKWEIA
ncbi:hypothetical protein LTR37_003057 [Vermiconidia calcicola]|uniref:Uncharacterized protein n=1 Tax=Vermiconidia calcicola TaxID=1690605 RepID=A0ACC3NRF7_9PEZI|nr:hypothetical protein LTR37_003057 [Vermiconidia calcicola]